MKNKYCVYIHRRKDTGVVFYVGEGTERRPRAACKYTRSKAWLATVEEAGGFTWEIVKSHLTKAEAQELEVELKMTYENLVNHPSARFPRCISNADIDNLRCIFEISSDSKSGLVWKVGSGKCRAGSQAGTVRTVNNKNYWSVKYMGVLYRVHRVIAAIAFGEIPSEMVVDHIDGDGLNNKIENLRVCTQTENMHLVNTRGVKTVGVKYSRRHGMWVAYWQENGRQITKSFSVSKYGEQAYELALAYRAEMTQRTSFK